MTEPVLLDLIHEAILDLNQLIVSTRDNKDSVILHRLIRTEDEVEDELAEDFQALSLAALFLQKELSEDECHGKNASMAAQQIATAALFECVLLRHPEIVERFHEHHQRTRQQLSGAITHG